MDIGIISRFDLTLQNLIVSKPQPSRPEVLYHYTNAAGLMGIVRRKRLWATDVRYLNDSSEVTYATSLLDQVINDVLATISNVHAAEFVRRFKGASFASSRRSYVACFCENGDLLNQWRVYSARDGYSIGFQAKFLARTYGPSSPRLIRVVYEVEQQREAILHYLRPLAAFLEQELATYDVTDLDQVAALQIPWFQLHQVLMQTILAFKHPAFAVEHEWRLFCSSDGLDERLDFRGGPNGLTPYVELDITKEDRLPLTSVRVGPCARQDSAVSALRDFMAKREYTDVTIDSTLLPVQV